jgi:hypothetical protein
MKRMVLVVAVGLLWGLSLPSAGLGQGADSYAVGGGKGDFGEGVLFTFNLSAHDYDGGPNGDFGHVGGTLTDAQGNRLSYRIDVDCVKIPNSLGDASISGIVTKAKGGLPASIFNFAVGDRLLVGARDGGNPSAKPVDAFGVAELPPSASADICESAGFVFVAPNVTQGNIVLKF